MKKIIFIFGGFLLFSCGTSGKRPSDFYFQLIYETDSYNSETGKFKRDYISLEPRKDTVVIENLTDRELDSAYQIISENNFFSLPETFECDETGDYTFKAPGFKTTILVQSNGMAKKVKYNDGCSPKKDLESERKFEIIHKKLRGLVYEKSRIENLPGTQMVFL